MKLTVVVGCLFSISVAVVSAGQSSRQGAPARLVIESMTGVDSFMFYCTSCHRCRR